MHAQERVLKVMRGNGFISFTWIKGGFSVAETNQAISEIRVAPAWVGAKDVGAKCECSGQEAKISKF